MTDVEKYQMRLYYNSAMFLPDYMTVAIREFEYKFKSVEHDDVIEFSGGVYEKSVDVRNIGKKIIKETQDDTLREFVRVCNLGISLFYLQRRI